MSTHNLGHILSTIRVVICLFFNTSFVSASKQSGKICNGSLRHWALFSRFVVKYKTWKKKKGYCEFHVNKQK